MDTVKRNRAVHQQKSKIFKPNGNAIINKEIIKKQKAIVYI